jgi:hypothetical protein
MVAAAFVLVTLTVFLLSLKRDRSAKSIYKNS